MSKKGSSKNLKLAGLFVVFVFGLILLSALLKTFLIIKTSRFDGTHNFIVNFVGTSGNEVVAFSPQNNSYSVLALDKSYVKANLKILLEIPIDAVVSDFNNNNIPSALLQSIFSFGRPLKNLTVLDALRLFLFAKTVPTNKIYERQFIANLNSQQKTTVISLSFTDPAIYQENQAIQIINASNVYGLGTRLATLITNIGGNVVLVSTSDQTVKSSKIVYYGSKTYTVKNLSEYLGFPAEQSTNKGVADVIITIGTDKAGGSNF
jgi:hypothetical protein